MITEITRLVSHVDTKNVALKAKKAEIYFVMWIKIF